MTSINIGAVIIAAGFEDKAILPAGKISVVQRIVAVFRKIGINMIVVVTGNEDKLLEKQLSQSGVLFLRNKNRISRELSAKAGLEFLHNKCERIFLVDADRPLVSPKTLKCMLSSNGELTVPMFREKAGQPLLLSGEGVIRAVEQIKPKLDTVYLSVEDDGVLLTGAEAGQMEERLTAHDAIITGVSMDLSIHCGRQLVDRKLVGLLYLIDETQSVREACGRIHISYSTAWNILNHAEAELGYALVQRNKGGASGSGSVLTDKGSKLLSAYLELEAKIRSNAEAFYEQIFDGII